MNIDNRIAELLALAERESIALPYSPEQILEFEDAGFVVDLRTGELIIESAAILRYDATTAAEAILHVWSDL